MFAIPTIFTVLFSVLVTHGTCQSTVTIYPQILAQGGRTQFETDRWNSHNGLDADIYIAGNNVIGSRTGRWLNPDLNGDIFPNCTEDPARRGYPDPVYFNNPDIQQTLCSMYVKDLDGYGGIRKIVMETKGQFWPKWMDTSQHGGVFPNNLDAGAEMVLLLVDAVNNYTGGQIPVYFEVINEPDTLWQHVTWDTVIEYHKIVAQKLHAKYPLLKVGGPTYTGAVADLDQNNFTIWKAMRDFMNMSLEHMDFLSFHPYNSFYARQNEHRINGINEARLVAVIDMVESYALLTRGKVVPLITSEYGLGGVDVDPASPASVVEWAYIFLHNSHMFTYLNHREVMEQAVAFILSHDTFGFENGSLFYQNGTEKYVTKAYRLWKNFTTTDQFLRVESQYDGQERLVPSLALADSTFKTVTVLLHNYAQTSTGVELNFYQDWIKTKTAEAKCLYLDQNKIPILVNHTVTFRNYLLYLPPESTCFLKFSANFPLDNVAFVDESTLYSRDIVISLESNVAQTSINLPSSITSLIYARLRFAVSTSDMSTQSQPTSVTINDHSIQDFYTLYDPDRVTGVTKWEVYNYQVPITVLKPGNNTIGFVFDQTEGRVSTVALVVGNTRDNKITH